MAKRVQLLTGYLSEGATGSATTTAAGYDAQNVVELERSATWKASSTAACRLMLDLGAAAVPEGLGIVGGNWSAMGTVTVQHSPDGATWTHFATLAGLPAAGLDYFSALTSAPSKQWWCLYWAAPSAAPEVAAFYLGNLDELATNPDIGQSGEDEYNVAEERATSGAVIAEEYGRRIERFTLGFEGIPSAEFLALRTLIRGEGGNLRPFFYIPRDDSGAGASGQAFLVRAASRFSWAEVLSGVFSCGVVLREEA